MLRFLTAGESHGPCLTAIIEGLPANLEIDIEKINHELARRQVGYGRNQRMKIESDHVQVLAGLIYGKTSGAPLALMIENLDWNNWKEKWETQSLPALTIPRPGHADLAGMLKYHVPDARLILERASARETAMRVAVGAVARQLLDPFKISIGSHVTSIGKIKVDETLYHMGISREELWVNAEKSDVRCPFPEIENLIKKEIDTTRRNGDTLGGTFEVAALNVPIGLGSHVHWERRLDAQIAAAIMSIPAIKGVEIGPAFHNASLMGSEVHDQIFPADDGGVQRKTNRAGGIEGGISNGSPIFVLAAMKPIPTTNPPQASMDMNDGSPALPIYQRSDVCAVPSAAVIAEAMLAWVLAQAVMEKYGGDSIEEMTR